MTNGYLPCRITSYSALGLALELLDRRIGLDRVGDRLHALRELLGSAALEHELVGGATALVVHLLVPGVPAEAEVVRTSVREHLARRSETRGEGQTLGRALHHGEHLGQLGELARTLLGEHVA